MKKDFSTRCANEAKTHEIFDEFFEKQADVELDWLVYAVACTFKAFWSRSMTPNKVLAIIIAVHSIEFEAEAVENALRFLVRKGCLRKTKGEGVVRYEVNY